MDQVYSVLKLHLKVVVTVGPVPGVLILAPERRDYILEEGDQEEEHQVPHHTAHYRACRDLVERLGYSHSPGDAEQEDQEDGNLLEHAVEHLPQHAEQVVVKHPRSAPSEQCYGNRKVCEGGDTVYETDDYVEGGDQVFPRLGGEEEGAEDVSRDADQSTEKEESAECVVERNVGCLHPGVGWVGLHVGVVNF